MDHCPKCNCDSLFVDETLVALLYDGTLVGERQAVYCNSPSCPERFWWYPKTGRITRRHTGPVSKYYFPEVS